MFSFWFLLSVFWFSHLFRKSLFSLEKCRFHRLCPPWSGKLNSAHIRQKDFADTVCGLPAIVTERHDGRQQQQRQQQQPQQLLKEAILYCRAIATYRKLVCESVADCEREMRSDCELVRSPRAAAARTSRTSSSAGCIFPAKSLFSLSFFLYNSGVIFLSLSFAVSGRSQSPKSISARQQ